MAEHYFSSSHPHSNNLPNQYAFTVTTPSQDESALHSPGSILGFASATTGLSTSFNFSNPAHSLYQIDEKKSVMHHHQHQAQPQHHHYPPSSMLSPLSPHLPLGSPTSTRAGSSDLEDDLQRKKALNRLSLASSIASSAPSTTSSEVDGSENEVEGHDYDMRDGQYLNFSDSSDGQSQHQGSGSLTGRDTEMSSLGRARGSTLSDAFRFQNGDRLPDLVHSRSNATIQARYQNEDRSPLMSPSEGTSSHSNVAEFVFSDFIADAAHDGGGEDEALQRTVDGAQALSLYSSPTHHQQQHLQQDNFATPQRPMMHRDVSQLSVGEPSSLQNSLPIQHYLQAFSSCPTSPSSPLTSLPTTSFETPTSSGAAHYHHQQGPSAAAAYAALHRPPQLGANGRSFSFNVIPAHHQDQPNISSIHDPQGLFSDRDESVNVGIPGHRASEGGNGAYAAGLGLFGYGHRPDSLGRSFSLPGHLFNNEPLSCNPAHITPRSSHGTDRDSISSPAGSLNVSSMVLFDSDGADSPISPYDHGTFSSPEDVFNELEGADQDEMEEGQNTIKSPRRHLREASSPTKTTSIRMSAKRLFSATTAEGDPSISLLSSSAPSAPAAFPSSAAVKRTPSNSRSARGTRRSQGLTINASRSRSPGFGAGSPSSAGFHSSAQGSPYLSPAVNYNNGRSTPTSSLSRSPLAGTPGSPADSVSSVFSLSSHLSANEGSLKGTPSSSLASTSVNAEGVITKRSRGRRVPDDPSELNNLGKMGKIYTCQVEGCGKCFKRSEHLKRHVRSIHTDDKRE